MAEPAVLYSTHCPKCKMLEKRLIERNIPYIECSDVDLMLSKGIKAAPFLEVDGELMDFGKAWKWASEVQN